MAGLVLEGRSAAAIGAAPRALRPVLSSAVQTSFAAAMHSVFLVSSAVALISGLVALCIRSRDVPTRERAMATPTRAGLATAERGRAQLVPGPFARRKARPVEVVRPAVVHVEVVHAEVAPAQAAALTEPGGTPVETQAVFTTPADGGFDEPSSSDAFRPGPTTVDVPRAPPCPARAGRGERGSGRGGRASSR